MRAEAELRGIIAGDQVDGEADYRESVRQAFGDEALTVEEGDPVNKMVSENDFAQSNAVRERFTHSRSFNNIR